jgi:SAM-dependent methyltransferase
VVSRFGLMFVADPARALASLHRALKPGGRAAFAVWGPLRRNPIAALSADLTREFLGQPPPAPERGPHPLRFGRRGALADLMRSAGFRAVRASGVRVPTVHGSAEECMAMYLGFPNPLRDLYLSLPARDRARMRARFLGGVRRFRSGAVVRVPGFAWVVAGRR